MSKQHRPFYRPLSTGEKVLAVLLAGFCAAVLYSRVYVEFERVRVSVVWKETLPSDASVRVPLPDLSALEGKAAAIIVRLANEEASSLPMRIFAGNDELSGFVVGSQRVERIDLSIDDAARLAAEGSLELRSDGGRDGWVLERLEVANVHGFSGGPLAFVIVPASAGRPNAAAGASAGHSRAVPGLAVGLAFLVFLTLPGLGYPFEGKRARIAKATTVGLILSLFSLVLAAPLVSGYKLLLSPQAFLLFVAGLYLPALIRFLQAVTRTIQRLDGRVQRWWEKALDPTMPATAPRWGSGTTPRGLKLVVALLALWLLGHAGNLLAGADYVPSSRLSIGRTDSIMRGTAVAATGPESYGCLGCSVVLISIDTLRADHLGSYGHPLPTSPEIDEFADTATLFTTTIAPASTTLVSHASMMTSLVNSQHGARVRPAVRLADEALTLAEILQGAGYQTAAFAAGGQLDPVYGLTQGFDIYDSRARRDFQGTVDASIAWLDEEPRGKFFLFMHTYEVHTPYTPRDRYWALLGADEGTGLPRHVDMETIDALNTIGADGRPSFTDAEVRHVARAYDAGIRSVDDAFGRLLGELKQRALYEDVLLIFTSDHGEELGEHGRVGHHGGSGFDEVVKVPLIIRFPRGSFSSTRVDSQVRTIDIAPTILDVVGLEQPPSFLGSSLVDVITGDDEGPRLAVSEAGPGVLAIRTARWKYLRGQLYSLRADPAEHQDLTPFFPAVRNWMEFQQGLLDSLPRLGNAESIVPSEDVLRELRALGYIR